MIDFRDISVSVLTCRAAKRWDWIDEIWTHFAKRVGAFNVIVNDDDKTIWEGLWECYTTRHSDSKWHLVLEDDMTPFPNTLEMLATVAAQGPRIISPFSHLKSVNDNERIVADNWFVSNGLMSAVSFMPSEWIDPFVEYGVTQFKSDYIHGDVRLMSWALVNGKVIWYPRYSFVDHRGAMKSLWMKKPGQRMTLNPSPNGIPPEAAIIPHRDITYLDHMRFIRDWPVAYKDGMMPMAPSRKERESYEGRVYTG